MMLASGSTSSRMRVAASSTSNRVRSLPPVIEISRPCGALHRGLVEQRIGDRRLGRLDGAPLAGGLAGAHHRLAHLAHHRADVGEVEIDQAFLDHQVGDAGDARIEHLVGHREGVGEGGLLVGDAEEVLVGDDDQRVDAGLQFARCPGSATRMRRWPSNWNGLVTTPTVRMPCSRAARAMTGAAPVPVPPPMPAVTKTMCEPASDR